MKWALVRADGGIAAQSGGITLAAKPSAGTYILSFGSAVTGKPILAPPLMRLTGRISEVRPPPVRAVAGAEGRTCPTSDNSSSIMVQARGNDGNPADHAFYVAIFG